MTRLTVVRTLKLPAGRPLPAGRVPTAAGPLSAGPLSAGLQPVGPLPARRRLAGRHLNAGRTAATLSAIAAVLAASACAASSAATKPAAAGARATAAASARAKAVAPVSAVPASAGSGGTGSASCPTAAWATEVTSAGKVAWKVSLPLASSGGVTDGLSPVLSGNYAVLAEGHSLVGLRLSDGRQLWRRVFPQAKNSLTGQISFLYGFHNEVIALVGQVSTDTRLVAVSVKTGAVSWTLPLGSAAVIGAPVVTIDSVFAFLTPRGRLEAVSLWTGKLLWSRAYGLATGAPALAALGSRVIAAKTQGSATASSVTSFVAQTGKVLWTRTGLPEQPTLLTTPGSVFVYDADQNVYPLPKLFPVTELNPANGKTQWSIPTAGPVSAVWSSWSEPDALVIATAGRTPRLIGADPITHRVRWSAGVSVDTGTTPLDFAGQLIYAKTAASPVTLVARDGASGQVRWSLPIPAAFPRFLAATGGGTILLSYGQATVPGKAGALIIGWTGKVIAKISLPAPAQAPPAVTEGNDVVLQLDTLACATAAVGTAADTAAIGTAGAASTAG